VHAVGREEVEQARKDFHDAEVLALRYILRPHAELQLSSLAEVVERHRHDRLGHGAMIVEELWRVGSTQCV